MWRQRTCEEAFARGRALKQASFFIYLTNLKEQRVQRGRGSFATKINDK